MLKAKRFLIGLAAVVITLAGGAYAAGIYKWTDADGNIHYEDRPSGSATETRMALSYSRTDPGSVQAQKQGLADSVAARQEARAKADEDAKSAAEEAAKAADKQKKCETYRARLQTFIQSRRLYRQDENGERVYLDETETQTARQKVEELIAAHCSSCQQRRPGVARPLALQCRLPSKERPLDCSNRAHTRGCACLPAGLLRGRYTIYHRTRC
ncbi:MAG: DUF4124 domain-containing protein [Gammaproteobacteria bacterium]|nr:DUF4124 domain-containing protein [Gammaproteobacteria bacterium]